MRPSYLPPLTLVAGLLLFGLSGCESTSRFLKDRELMGCYRVDGYAQGYLTVHGLVATGGTTMEECAAILWP